MNKANQPSKKVRKRTQLRAQGYRFDHDIGDWVLHPKYGKRQRFLRESSK